jgi:hypothetical protein
MEYWELSGRLAKEMRNFPLDDLQQVTALILASSKRCITASISLRANHGTGCPVDDFRVTTLCCPGKW